MLAKNLVAEMEIKDNSGAIWKVTSITPWLGEIKIDLTGNSNRTNSILVEPDEDIPYEPMNSEASDTGDVISESQGGSSSHGDLLDRIDKFCE